MRSRRFYQCDVFSPVPTQGNALAVVVDGDGISESDMQRFAAWTNLAETTFLLPPTSDDADYRVRIFTPAREMLFAGHPTLGSCAAWLWAGGQPSEAERVRQECGVGIVEVDILSENRLAFAAPPTEIRPMAASIRADIVAALGLSEDKIIHTSELANGPVWQAFHLASASAVLAVDSARVRWPAFQGIGLVGPHPNGHECDFEVRMLAPSSGMGEDPITGSLNAALAHWLYDLGVYGDAVEIAQGTSIGRCGRVSISASSNRIMVGGEVHGVIDGTMRL